MLVDGGRSLIACTLLAFMTWIGGVSLQGPENGAPFVDAGPDQHLLEYDRVRLDEAVISDDDVGGDLLVIVFWGDGAIESVQVDPATGTVLADHEYLSPGSYEVILIAIDSVDGIGHDRMRVEIVPRFPRYC